jgi:hypothetical protein
MLVGRDGLGRRLAANPRRFFRQDDAHAAPQGGEGGRKATHTPADHSHITQ